MRAPGKRHKSPGLSSTSITQSLYDDGKLFSEAAFRETTRIQLLQKAMHLRDLVVASKPTSTHRWLASLGPQLLRLYTQNVDMLEDKAGLNTGLGRQFNCVRLHGTLADLQCCLCQETFPWENFRADIGAGRDLLCPRCADCCKAREAAGKRRRAIGLLRPSMVMLDGYQPEEEEIADLARGDCADNPEVFLILGTSLKVHGPKTLARQFARVVQACGGMVVYVNRTKPSSEWNGLINYWVQWECDEWVCDLLMRQKKLQQERGGPNSAGCVANRVPGSCREHAIMIT